MRLPKPPATLRPWLPLGIGAVVVALLMGVAIGRVMPDTATETSPARTSASNESGGGHSHSGTPSKDRATTPDLEGQSLSASGFTLVPSDTKLSRSDTGRTWSFTITDTEGKAVTDFATVHDKKMHLFAVRRDFTGYQHMHPTMDRESGRWKADITFGSPGSWRVIAGFSAGQGKDATPTTLGTDVTVPGDYSPKDVPKPEPTTTTEGFDVTMGFKPAVGVSTPALVAVTKDRQSATLDRYLGAYGHLVMLRQNDMGFAHVHPDSEKVGSRLRFWSALPSKGTYRAFMDFKIDGKVRTASFTITV